MELIKNLLPYIHWVVLGIPLLAALVEFGADVTFKIAGGIWLAAVIISFFLSSFFPGVNESLVMFIILYVAAAVASYFLFDLHYKVAIRIDGFKAKRELRRYEKEEQRERKKRLQKEAEWEAEYEKKRAAEEKQKKKITKYILQADKSGDYSQLTQYIEKTRKDRETSFTRNELINICSDLNLNKPPECLATIMQATQSSSGKWQASASLIQHFMDKEAPDIDSILVLLEHSHQPEQPCSKFIGILAAQARFSSILAPATDLLSPVLPRLSNTDFNTLFVQPFVDRSSQQRLLKELLFRIDNAELYKRLLPFIVDSLDYKDLIPLYLQLASKFDADPVTLPDENGIPLLHRLYRNDTDLSRITAWIQAGLDVDMRDSEGRTLLMLAQYDKDQELVGKLLDSGADPQAVDAFGQTVDQYRDYNLFQAPVPPAEPVAPAEDKDKNTKKQQTPSRGDLAAQYMHFFNFTIPESGILLLIGAASSGLREFVENIPDAFLLRGSYFTDREAYNQVVGSAPGYIGSETPTQFVQFVRNNPKGTVIIDGIGAASGPRSLLAEFVTMITGTTIHDKTGKYTSLSPAKLTFIFVLDRDMETDHDLDEDRLRKRVLNLKGENSPLVPDILVEKADQVVNFYTLRDRFDDIPRLFTMAFSSPSPAYLRIAADLFYLDNSALFEIKDKRLGLQNNKGILHLLADGQEYTRIERINDRHYDIFKENLDGYLGQDEAVSTFKKALSGKIGAVLRLINDALRGEIYKDDDRNRPVSLLCIGPPGIGKTELAKRLGKTLSSFVRIDGNTINHVSEIFGHSQAPGDLSNQLIRGVPSVILVDEVEKLDAKSRKAFLQLIDEGRFVDRYQQETWAVRDTMIIFTSNIIRDPDIGAAEARDRLKTGGELAPELVDRMNYVVPFRFFTDEEKIKVARNVAQDMDFALADDDLPGVIATDSIREIKLNVQKVMAEKEQQRLERGAG